MPTDFEFIKRLFIEIDAKVEKLQARTDSKLDNLEEKILSEIKELRMELTGSYNILEKDVQENKISINKHDGHFNTIKIFTTSGIASLIAFYTWIVSVVQHPK